MAVIVEGEVVPLLNDEIPTVPQGTTSMTFRDTRAEGADIVHDAELHAIQKLEEEEA
ncbi:hypothetical protein RvY_02077 [Ramazzottius varieornatus]|uniref:Uncharacterized protein n=1 Tax=Ramazzottius varieornatus TaxID=947166 RepID=A0A1D1UM95_RAMVA|nr:hypothetical protein RvY_02077 [Ramazzottius varieornatus]